MSSVTPADAAELAEIVSRAAAEGAPLEIVAGGSKRGLGRFAPVARRLDISRLSGVIDYDPAELVLTARAATPLAEIIALLAAQRQMLAFEPPDWVALFGHTGAPTLGGVLAVNQSGPRRLKAGAARDHLLGFAAVNGLGQIWKAGARVVKNVTGYDMAKLQAGSFGTLSVLTEVSVKVLPRPETELTLLWPVAEARAAVARMSAALNTPHEVSGAAYLPARGVVALRLEGPAPSVAHRAAALGGERLDEAASAALWHDIGAVLPVLGAHAEIWRLNPEPAAAPAVLAALHAHFPEGAAFLDWGGGLLWLGLPRASGGAVRTCLRGGHATLFAAPEDVRASADVFEPLPPPLAALTRRVKQGFDPLGILNPRRMYREF